MYPCWTLVQHSSSHPQSFFLNYGHGAMSFTTTISKINIFCDVTIWIPILAQWMNKLVQYEADDPTYNEIDDLFLKLATFFRRLLVNI
jgi:hypothetical protein